MLSPDPHKSPLILQQFKWGERVEARQYID
jgi:hypothetical protein